MASQRPAHPFARISVRAAVPAGAERVQPRMPGPLLASQRGGRGVVWLVVALGASAFAFPFVFAKSKGIGNRVDFSKPLSPSATMRGAYLNTGSRDIGPDPNWDRERGVYVSPKVRKEQAPDAATRNSQ